MEKNEKELLAGCVILYHPDISILYNIKTYLSFLDVLYVIDNSDNNDDTLTQAICALGPKIKFVSNNGNVGIASGLNMAATMALAKNYNWLLTMDQDSFFSEDAFFDQCQVEIFRGGQIGLLAASYTTHYDRKQKSYSDYFNEIHYIITSGNIINLTVWSTVNGFDEKLFIDEVDHEYCLKLQKANYKVLITREILMSHAIGEYYDEEREDNMNARNGFVIHSPVRYYYMARNTLYLCKKYFFVDVKFALMRLYYLAKVFAKIVLKYPDKRIYLRYFFAGLSDFFVAKYGKYDK